MRYLRSHDGTRIAYEKTGEGPGLIIIGGSLADHRCYIPLAGELASRFTVYSFDRRGRGQSTDTDPYAAEREIEDFAALLAEADEPILVYGHSAGSALALRSAAAGLNIAKLVLADPPYAPHGDADDAARARQAEDAAAVQALHDKGDHRGNAARFLRGFGLPAGAVDEMLDSPAGDMTVDSARALPYDYALVGDRLVPNDLAARAEQPTLILADEAAPTTAEALVKIMPSAQLDRLRASTHDLPAEEIAAAVTPFVSTPLQPTVPSSDEPSNRGTGSP